jgi:N-acetylmuramoyl-L-alanine amidase
LVRFWWALALAVAAGPAGAARVAVDVGHYLQKPGATSARGVPEFEYNLALALALAKSLAARGHTTLLIGADGLAEDLTRRSPRAAGMDLFISIHHDSVQERFLQPWEYEGGTLRFSDRFAGFSIFVSRDNRHLPQSLACASAIGERMQQSGFTRSLYHADSIVGESREFADERNGVHYFDRLAVLRTSPIPGLLFEAGVIVNRDEELRMRDPAVRQAIAASIADGVTACLQR